MDRDSKSKSVCFLSISSSSPSITIQNIIDLPPQESHHITDLFFCTSTRALSPLDGSNLLYYSSGVMCVVDTTTKERKYLTCSNSANAVITSSTLSSAGLFFATDEPNFFCLTNDFQILSYPVLVSTRIYSAMCATDTHLLLFCENGDKSLLVLSFES